MCGLAGLWRFHNTSEDDLQENARLMSRSISHRGPDDFGEWHDAEKGLILTHQRLSILDLSQAGHQPMISNSGRYVIAFNGEIYNHLDLRKSLLIENQAPPWHGHSDTETLLAAFEAWGIENTLKKSVGMFAIALWDRKQKILHLVRDRFGEKPLYYGFTGDSNEKSLVFASELSAIRSIPAFNNTISTESLTQLLRFSVLASPNSIYKNIKQLCPGQIISFSYPIQSIMPKPKSWWCFRSILEHSKENLFLEEKEGLLQLESTLAKTINQQSLADVPLGSFLSGGIDSSLITALLQKNSMQPVRTMTIAFEENSYNEAPYARAVADHLGTDHTETILTANDAFELITSLPRIYSEPFADSSQLPTHLVCREARKKGLTVALSGDGGDELFGGYNRYFWGPRIWNQLSWLPIGIRHILGSVVNSIPPSRWDCIGHYLPINQVGHKAHKLADRLVNVRTSDELYRSLVSEWRDPKSMLLNRDICEASSPIDWSLPESLLGDPVARMMAYDTLNYLPNDILTKVDRAAMAVGLETRSPFLDHRVAEIACRLPMKMKIRKDSDQGQSKWALRQILYKYVPQHLIDRPKAGFAMPIGMWLRNELRPWAEDLLSNSLIRKQGYLQPELIQKLWKQHLSEKFDHTNRLWTILMWQAWLQEWHGK